MSECKFISCFSYKGGAGRSTLAINVVPFLAEMLGATKEHPFVLVDMDIDSCGLTYLFNLDKNERVPTDCVQRWLHPKFTQMPNVDEDDEIDDATEHAMFRRLFPVGNFFGFEDDRAILCLPANHGDTMGKDTNYDAPPSHHLNAFKSMCRDVACGVLFDSAVGNQLTANWSNHCANYIMCCMRPTKQFRDGTNHFFDKYDETTRGKKIIIIPNVVPTDELELDGKHYPDYAKNSIIENFSDNTSKGNNTYYLDLLEGEKFGVPKIDRFMWHEGVLKTAKNLNEMEKMALDRYRDIAAIIVNK